MFSALSRSVRLRSVMNPSNVCCANGNGEALASIVDYLMWRLGFTSMSTISSKSSSVAFSDNPNPVLEFLKEQGFSNVQITKIKLERPQFLAYNPDTIKPKIEFLKSIFEPTELVRVVTSHPEILASSLNKRLIPSFNFLHSIFESSKLTLFALRRFGDALLILPGSKAARNLEMLIKYGVPRSKLVSLLARKCLALRMNSKSLEEAVQEVGKMGFNLKTSKFVTALMVCLTVRNELWEEKVRLLKGCGWSEEEFMAAFRRHPTIGLCSNNKIAMTFNYLKEIGIKPGRIATYPQVLGMSFQKRIVPRASVYKLLASNGLLSDSVSLYSVFCDVENNFVRRYVNRDDVKGLKKLYKNQLETARQTPK